MEREQKNLLWRLGVSAVLAAVVLALPLQGGWTVLLWLVPYLIAGYGVLREALEGVLHGELLDENFLMAVATVGALALGEYPEAVFVMLLFGVGELLETLAEGRARRSIAALMDVRPDFARVERGGVLTEVAPDTVAVGETLVVKPGEKIPLDGEITEGETTLNTAALTGEALPRTARPGDAALSGCVNLSGVIRIRTTKPYGDSTVAKILELVETSGENKGRSERFITRFARVYTPCVVALAVLLAVLPSLVTGAWGVWIHRALIFLVVSCPCALVISVPLTYFGGIGAASRQGILVKGGRYLDALRHCEIAVFDKTGTLTEGRFTVSAVSPVGCGEAALLETAALAELWSGHPIAAALRGACGEPLSPDRVAQVTECAGRGVCATVDGRAVLVGSERLLAERGVAVPEQSGRGTAVHVSADGVYLGSIAVADKCKAGAAETIAALKRTGVRKTVMLTGDRRDAAETVGAALGIDEIRAELLPGDKVAEVERLLAETGEQRTLVFVGDGINDAPVLRRADVGVAMGALGADAAIEAADVVLMDDAPEKLLRAIALARRTGRIAAENIVFSIAVKLTVLALAAAGLAGMWLASFADVGVCCLAILNAARAFRA